MAAGALKIPILMYHRIGPRISTSIVRDQYVPAALFEKQLQALQKQGYQSISLSEMKSLFIDKASTGKYIVITFDDGYKSFTDSAIPILKKHGMKATVFLVGNCIGHTNRWDEAKGDVSEPLLNREEILFAHKQGMEIGAHTMSHPDLRFCPDEMAQEEITRSKFDIESDLKIPIQWFSYPFGKNGERERRLVKEAGFLGACGTDKHTNTPETDLYDLGRVNVRATSSPAYLLHKLRKVAE
ncbi:MAG TPA: polysaccharide deacetylase family protein [Fimbriimonadaceae bacterium]|jgi:peptidoglycan/xylan/chitin deacetylase (PgdA/CDA1 family)